MFTDTLVQKELLPVLSSNTLDIALELFENHNSSKILENLPQRGYELIYSEEIGKVYGSDGCAEVDGLKASAASE